MVVWLEEILIGLGTGLVVGITGASGVLLVVPLLTIIMGVSMQQAIGTSLFVDVITSLVVSISYFRHGSVNLKAALWLAVGAFVGAQGGALVSNKITEDAKFLNIGFLIFLFAMAISMWFKKADKPIGVEKAHRLAEMNWRNFLITFGIGLVLGINSGLFGAGGGMAFFLVLLIILKYPTRLAIGTSTMIMGLTAVSGTIGYTMHGNVDYSIGIIIAIAAVISGLLSARLAHKIPEKVLNRIVGVIFAAIGVMMIFLK
jgi:uncharacterized membrane protein YfcA